jgi:hypothetical protein
MLSEEHPSYWIFLWTSGLKWYSSKAFLLPEGMQVDQAALLCARQ